MTTEPEYQPLTEGDHTGTVVEFGAVFQLESKRGFSIPVILDIGGRMVRSFVIGQLSAVAMILAAKDSFVGKSYRVKIKNRANDDGRVFQSVDVEWHRVPLPA